MENIIKTFLITGGAGFIGSALVRYLIQHTEHKVVNVDKLTYAGNLASLAMVQGSSRYRFEQADICDREAIAKIFAEYQPDVVMHLAAESHVDHSIDSPRVFIDTNIMGTYLLLEQTRVHYESLPETKKKSFRFHHISTDEVYGDIPLNAAPCTEEIAYQPSSPYAASKASADHLVRAWHRTYGLPIVLTNCSNNYGAYQFPEKFIPVMILNALAGKNLPIYGDGKQIRDWLLVDDHVRALLLVVEHGKIGHSYNIGADNERQNIEVVQLICDMLAKLKPQHTYLHLIEYVTDRLGHDRRYAIDARKIRSELGWQPHTDFETGLYQTVQWYVEHAAWCANMRKPII